VSTEAASVPWWFSLGAVFIIARIFAFEWCFISCSY